MNIYAILCSIGLILSWIIGILYIFYRGHKQTCSKDEAIGYCCLYCSGVCMMIIILFPVVIIAAILFQIGVS